MLVTIRSAPTLEADIINTSESNFADEIQNNNEVEENSLISTTVNYYDDINEIADDFVTETPIKHPQEIQNKIDEIKSKITYYLSQYKQNLIASQNFT